MKYLQISTPNTTQVVSTADLKTHLRITFSNDDTYIETLAMAAQQTLEKFCNIFLLETECNQYGFEISDLEILFKSPILSTFTPVLYVNQSASWVAQSGVEFITNSKPARMYLNNTTIDTPDTNVTQKYKVNYKVGYDSASDIPKPLIQAIKIIVADMYENRQSVIVGKTVAEIPKTAEYLMQNYKVQTV
tara:strand:+ start:1002 stop:1571 length:570 start_codon:yes stop_codon:yes gene_type:complete